MLSLTTPALSILGKTVGGSHYSNLRSCKNRRGTPNDSNTVTSSGTFGGQFGEVSWTATSSIRPGSQLMTTRYAFVAGDNPIGPLRVLQYLDEDVNPDGDPEGFRDDVFLSQGSADDGNLSLYALRQL